MGAIHAWLWWLVAALGLAVLEIVTTTLVFGMFAIAAGAAALAAYLGVPFVGQAIICAVATIGLVIFVRPVARRHLMRTPHETRTGIAALVGQTALVLERVDGEAGQIKVRGEVWSARAYEPGQVLEPGSRADIIEITGAIALVYGTEPS